MATYTYPGVYIQEVPKGPGPVQSASPSTCAMVGFTDEGPINEPTLVTSFPEFTAKFGSFTADGRLPTAAFAYFQNGGQNLVVVRTVGAGSSTAQSVIGEFIGVETQTLSPAPNGVINAFSFGLSNTPVIPQTVSFTIGGVTYTDDGEGIIQSAGPVNRGTIDYVDGTISVTTAVAPVVGSQASVTYEYENMRFVAKSAGAWGNDLTVQIEGDSNSLVGGEFTAFIVSVLREDSDGQSVAVEVLNNIDFDVNSANFIATRMNDARRGSAFVSVVVGSNPQVPVALRDFSTTDSLAPVGALNGVNKAFTFTIHTPPVVQGSLRGVWRLGTSQTFNDLTGQVKPIYDVTGQSHLSVTVTTSVGDVETFAVTQTGGVGTAIVEAFSVAPGDAANRLVGSFSVANPATGAWSILVTEQGSALPTITQVRLDYVRANALTVIDDGSGEIILDPSVTHDSDVSLAIAGPNSVNYQTGLISLTLSNPAPLNLVGANAMSFNYTSVNTSTSTTAPFSGGSDGAGLLRSDVSAPSLAADELGLYALNRREELLNVCIPDFASNELVSQDLIDYCETRKDRFAIISVPEGYSYTEAIDYKRNTLLRNSNRAAIYYPHLKISDPVSGNEINFPAVAHMAGVFARTDSVRNVSKAPAGTVDGRISFATGLEVELTPQQAGFVNQANINNLVSWSYTGLVAWGARTLEVNGDFPYIQMRRLFMFVEKSVFNSTQGFVFESNTAGLRAAIKLQIEAFLLGLHRSGHFAGTSPAQSFFVICDGSNNPQTTIDQGQLVVDVGIAPTKPAEFIVFRFQQKTIE